MVAVIALTIALIVLGFFAGLLGLSYIGHDGYYAGRTPFLGAIIGGWCSSFLWRALLKHYKYTSDLKPIKED
jgi:hypothetical protein